MWTVSIMTVAQRGVLLVVAGALLGAGIGVLLGERLRAPAVAAPVGNETGPTRLAQSLPMDAPVFDRTIAKPSPATPPAPVQSTGTAPNADARCTLGGRTLDYRPDRRMPDVVATSQIWQARTSGPLTVRFYATPAHGHVSVAFEYNPPDLLAARDSPIDYDCIIRIGEKRYSQSVQGHYQFQRWRVQNKPLPLDGDVRALVASWKLLPHGVPPNRPNWLQIASGHRLPDWRMLVGTGQVREALGKNLYTGPFSAAGFQTYMGAPGGRKDFGPVDEASACWVAMHPDLRPGTQVRINQNEWRVCEAAMRDGAEAVGSMPINVRDPATGGPLAYIGRYAGSWWQREVGKAVIKVNIPNGRDGGWTMDVAHFPAPAYVTALVSQDPYLIEAVMFSASYVIGNRNFQQRGFAKGQPPWGCLAFWRCRSNVPVRRSSFPRHRSHVHGKRLPR